MTDTDITALVERLRSSIHDAAWEKHALVQAAADALEMLQTERDAALFDKAVAGGKVRVARNAALEEAAQVADQYGYDSGNASPFIVAERIRALAGDKG